MAKTPRLDNSDQHIVAAHTLKAIDLIGADTATQIRATADAHLEEAKLVASKLYQLAEAIEGNTKEAADRLKAFTEHSKHVLETVQGLHLQLNGTPLGAEVTTSDTENAGLTVKTKLPVAPNLTDA